MSTSVTNLSLVCLQLRMQKIQTELWLKDGHQYRHMVLTVSFQIYNKVIGSGFFTMKHKIQNIKDNLNLIYSENDSFSLFRIIFDEIPRFNQTYYDTFFNLNRKPAEKRLIQCTEQSILDGLYVRYEQSKVRKFACNMEVF